ncbi:MAG: tetratricopeptide repeat protein [Thermoanaerobaculia bacterium]|nr:tetratricopeptide repeat protein [Thermoanaerobaculia bacterium]
MLLLAFLALLAITGETAPSPSGSPSETSAAPTAGPMTEVLADVQARRWGAAEPALRAALVRAPQAPVLHFLLGETLAGLGRRAEAVTELEQAVALRPDRPRFWHSLARVEADSGHCERALVALDRALALAAEPVYQYDSATCLVTLGRLQPAAARLDRALAGAPRHFAALLLRATVARDLGDPQGARSFADRALALAPFSPAAHTARGMALLDLERPASAIDDFRAALTEAPARFEAGYGLTQALRALDRRDEAAAELARIQEFSRQRERAEELTAALQLAPEATAQRVELARLLLASGEASAALRQLEVAVARASTDAALQELLARAKERKARWEP